jgi:hypothetical protein
MRLPESWGYQISLGVALGSGARIGDGDLGTVTAVGLGGVERSVGAADELVAVAGVIGDRGDTEAGGDLSLDSWDGDRGDGAPDLLSDGGRAQSVGVR